VNLLNPFFPLTSTFFGLSYKFKEPFLREVYACIQQYSDVMNMPTYERRFFINVFTEEIEKRKEKLEESNNKYTYTGKGTRTTKISGEKVKAYSGKM
jgi:hypothetical protein